MEILDLIFGNSGKPVRRTVEVKIGKDKKGKARIEPVQGELVSLSVEGSIDSVRVVPEKFYDCGCSAQYQIGGQCGEPHCEDISCSGCFGRCTLCQKPLCLRCSKYFLFDHGRPARLCSYCNDGVTRQRKRKALASALLHPIDSFRRGKK